MTPSSKRPAGPFAGLLVVDMTHVLAGPFGTTILSDLGARVVKVEPPDQGDDTRAYGPFLDGFLEHGVMEYVATGKAPDRIGNRHPFMAPFDSFGGTRGGAGPAARRPLAGGHSRRRRAGGADPRRRRRGRASADEGSEHDHRGRRHPDAGQPREDPWLQRPDRAPRRPRARPAR